MEVEVDIHNIREEEIKRASQLTQRSNQFNMSTIRRTEVELKKLIENQKNKCWVVEVSDKFGEYGLVGVIIGNIKKDEIYLDTFILSCRVLGRKVEDAVLEYLKKVALENHIHVIS